ncbi:MAG TPA: type II CRISPR-associated endonuclease Cas1 [Candidatus Kapabacteria bacterium]|nr:type II CRISPR-associated endonuclease Cas1 [Candidatus Kapabacteria bacterium]
MIRKTLLIEKDNYLSIKNEQLIITSKESGLIRSINPADVGIIIFDNRESTYTHSVISKLLHHNIAIIFCDDKRMPLGMFLNFESNYSQTYTINKQLGLNQAQKSRIWKQIIISKIVNQANLIQHISQEKYVYLKNLSNKVGLADKTNREGIAAKVYWKTLIGEYFIRDRDGEFPNNYLNYAYAILRSLTAKSLSGSGLLPIIGIHHHNQYNTYCLADDIMEAYRPFADALIYDYLKSDMDNEEKQDMKLFKRYIQKIATEDVLIGDLTRPLSIALTFTTSSLTRCICGESDKISLPRLNYESIQN